MENCQENQRLLLTDEAQHKDSVLNFNFITSVKLNKEIIFSKKKKRFSNVKRVLTFIHFDSSCSVETQVTCSMSRMKCIDGDTVK